MVGRNETEHRRGWDRDNLVTPAELLERTHDFAGRKILPLILDFLCTRQRAVICIEGEPGIGKTAFISALCESLLNPSGVLEKEKFLINCASYEGALSKTWRQVREQDNSKRNNRLDWSNEDWKLLNSNFLEAVENARRWPSIPPDVHRVTIVEMLGHSGVYDRGVGVLRRLASDNDVLIISLVAHPLVQRRAELLREEISHTPNGEIEGVLLNRHRVIPDFGRLRGEKSKGSLVKIKVGKSASKKEIEEIRTETMSIAERLIPKSRIEQETKVFSFSLQEAPCCYILNPDEWRMTLYRKLYALHNMAGLMVNYGLTNNRLIIAMNGPILPHELLGLSHIYFSNDLNFPLSS